MLIQTTLLALIALAQPVQADDDFPQPVLTSIAPTHVFAPTGFDNNDNAQVVLAGDLPNTCFRVGSGISKIDAEKKQIFFKSQAYSYESSWCLFVLVPYSQVVDLGPLAAGSYELFAENRAGKPVSFGSIQVGAARNAGPDDHLYASVKEALVSPKTNQSEYTISLSGTLPADCMRMNRVEIIQKAANVIEVLPIAEIKPGSQCHTSPIPFSFKTKFKSNFAGRTLLHVRSLNGQSLNKVIDL